MRFFRHKKVVVLAIALSFASALCAFIYNSEASKQGIYSTTAHGKYVDRSVITGQPFPNPNEPYAKGHCGHCHAAGMDVKTIDFCYECHEKLSPSRIAGYGRFGIYQGRDKYNSSIHYISQRMQWPAGKPGPSSPRSGDCHNCHNPHGATDASGLVPDLLIMREEKLCETCHDGSRGKDIKSQLSRYYRHPVREYSGRHIAGEKGASEGGVDFGNPPSYDRRHAECVDCHNPHAIGISGSVHKTPGNEVSDAIKNVWGVEPSWPSLWSQPRMFIVRRPPAYPDGAVYEYQICFKCHSFYGLGSLLTPVSTIIGPSGVHITDQAWEFNPNNGSAHPVAASLNSQTGSLMPRALTASQMSFPWIGIGSQTMYCSDCHGADNEDSGGAKGPHGSSRKFMLKGRGQYWPTRPDGSSLWRLNAGDGSDINLFCKNCHPLYDPAGWKNNVHSSANHNNLECVVCHVAVPHGYKNQRLIGYAADPMPYNYNNNSLKIMGFTKAFTPTGYTKTNCSTMPGCH